MYYGNRPAPAGRFCAVAGFITKDYNSDKTLEIGIFVALIINGARMALDKQDLKEIKKIVDGSIEKAIEKYETKMSDKIEFLINKSEMRLGNKIEKTEQELTKKIKESEDRTISKINEEVSDLSDINRAAISRTDQIDYRLRIVERKSGIKA